MRILHTADWHLADRLGRIDRTDDLKAAVERVADYCTSEAVDLLLVAGDLFSELARPDSLRDAIRHLQETFGPFLADGGTILALTGNHDNENFCQTLRHAMHLAAPADEAFGAVVPNGRLYLAAEPTLLRLADRQTGGLVQFVLMPYPTPARFLREEANQRYASLDEKNQRLIASFTAKLGAILADPAYDAALPSVLGAHVAVHGAQMASLFRLSEQEDVVFMGDDLLANFAYVALGHIHRPQFIGGQPSVRYSGSIERMDLGEKDDQKGVVVFDVGAAGLESEPRVLPLPSTPVYEVTILKPTEELPLLREQYPDAERDLVTIHLTYTAGTDNLEETLRELQAIFPRWYSRDWTETSALRDGTLAGQAGQTRSFADTVRDYLGQELAHHSEAERGAVLERVERLLEEEG